MPHPAVGRISSSLRPGLPSSDALLRRFLSVGLAAAPQPDLRPGRLHDSPSPRQSRLSQSHPAPDSRSTPSAVCPTSSGLAHRDQSPAGGGECPLCRSRTRIGQANHALGAALRLLVRGYQLFLSPMLPSACRFHPTCSVYMSHAIERHGPWRGVWLGLKRLGKCHPWHPGGIDPVPPSRHP